MNSKTGDAAFVAFEVPDERVIVRRKVSNRI